MCEDTDDMMKLILDDEEFKLKSYSFYDNPQAISIKEFKEDLKRYRYTKNIIEKYNVAYSSGKRLINSRLILNHIIVIHNLFGDFTAIGLFSKIEPEYWHILKTFLVFLDLMPKDFDPENRIKIDEKIMEELKNL